MTHPEDLEWPGALLNAPVQFWMCINPAHGSVTWEGDVATCPDCGVTSEMTKAYAKRVREQFAEELVQELADTERMWSDAEPLDSNACDAADEHNCHRVAGELTFAEAMAIVKRLGGIAP